MKDLLEGSVGVCFPNRTAPTLGTLVKDRLASNRESQIHLSVEMRDSWPQIVASRGSNAMFHLCRVRRRLCNSKIVVKGGRDIVPRYYYCHRLKLGEVAKRGRIYTDRLFLSPKSDLGPALKLSNYRPFFYPKLSTLPFVFLYLRPGCNFAPGQRVLSCSSRNRCLT